MLYDIVIFSNAVITNAICLFIKSELITKSKIWPFTSLESCQFIEQYMILNK